MTETIALKFGGTSLRDDEARQAAVAHVQRHARAGRSLAVVVSAMGRKGEPYATDTLIGLLRAAGEPVPARELDLAMSVGETLSAAYFSHLLALNGVPAQAFTGPQAGVLTNDVPGHAEILEIRPKSLQRSMRSGFVAVVAGFQGADMEGEIRTLGRGGSDTSAVALGAALGAREVEIYTDVDGIACADPRHLPQAPFLEEIGAAQILAMAEEGSKVLHPRAVAASLSSQTPIRVRNTFSERPGTLVHHRDASGPLCPVALAHRTELVRLSFSAEGEARELVPELLPIGGDSYFIIEDVYLEQRLAKLEQYFGAAKKEPGWGTASVILSHPDAAESAPSVSSHGERITTLPGRWRYAVRAERLDALLEELFERFLQ
jgi:aspartate kinase